MTDVENPEVAEFHIEPEIVGYKAFVKHSDQTWWQATGPRYELGKNSTTLDQLGLYATPEKAIADARKVSEEFYQSRPFDIKIFRIRL